MAYNPTQQTWSKSFMFLRRPNPHAERVTLATTGQTTGRPYCAFAPPVHGALSPTRTFALSNSGLCSRGRINILEQSSGPDANRGFMGFQQIDEDWYKFGLTFRID